MKSLSADRLGLALIVAPRAVLEQHVNYVVERFVMAFPHGTGNPGPFGFLQQPSRNDVMVNQHTISPGMEIPGSVWF